MRIWVKEFNHEYDFFESEICTKEGSKKEESDFAEALEFISISEFNKLKEENARLREALESILELNILGNDNQGKMSSVARQALDRGE